MDQNQEIIDELKNLNQKIEKFTKPGKFAWLNFIGGISHSLGAIFGTAIITLALIYIFSQFDFTKSISNWMEKTMSQVNWTKIIAPQASTIEQTQ